MAEGSLLSDLSIAATTGIKNFVAHKYDPVKYVITRPYISVLTFEAKRYAITKVLENVRESLNRDVNSKRRELIKKLSDARQKTHDQIVINGLDILRDYGAIQIDENVMFAAMTKYGEIVKTALILSYKKESGDLVNYGKHELIGQNLSDYRSNVIAVADLSPKIDGSSNKNVNITKVVGRDYGRKEIVGNSDVHYNVSGKFVSADPDVYPQDQVSRFIELCRINDIIDVNNLIFGQHNVSRIVITDYSLPQTECLNEQPYSFSCVAVEPEEDVTAMDTIDPVYASSEISDLEGWYQNILKSKKNRSLENAATYAIGTATEIAGSSIDDIVNNFLK